MSCLKISLIVFNLFIWTLGAAITALGIWVKTDGDFSKIQDNLDVKEFTTAGWILIFVGIIIMLIGFIGCYGAIASQVCMLIIVRS
uniref:Tetraspanin n=1 Tax=Parasteatoda tepidariorum TaxID=114398 RepID=A0A2L2YL38_PARTP